MRAELTSNSGGNINIEFPDRTLPTADKEHVEVIFNESMLEHRSSGFKEKDLHGLGVVNGDVEDISSKRDVRYTESKSPTKITQDENDSMGIDLRHSRRLCRSRSPVLRESVEPSKKRRRDEDANSDKYGVRRLAESSNTRSVSPNKSRDKYKTLEDSPSMNVGYHDDQNRTERGKGGWIGSEVVLMSDMMGEKWTERGKGGWIGRKLVVTADMMNDKGT